MPTYNGQNTKLQIGRETAWGSLVTPTLQLNLLSANINDEPTFLDSKALVGSAFAGAISPGMHIVKGTMSFEVTPESLGLIMWLSAGAEADPAAVTNHSGAFDHVFTPIVGAMLPSFSIIFDKGPDIFGYSGCKINTIKFEVTPDKYMVLVVEFIGKEESIGEDTETLSLAAHSPWKFTGFKVLTGTAGSAAATATDFVKAGNPSYNNNLDADRYRASGSAYTGEINVNNRQLKVSLECDLTDDTYDLREAFKAGTPISLALEYVSEEQIATTGAYYTLTINILYGYSTSLPNIDVPGPEHLNITLDIDARAGTNGDVSFVVRDDVATKIVTA